MDGRCDRRLRIGLDVTAAQRTRLTGWERFILNLRSSLLELDDPPDVVPLSMRRRARRGWSVAARQLGWYGMGLRLRAERLGVDVVHSPTFPPPKLRRPVVWTVHDDIIVGGHRPYARTSARLWIPLGRRAAGHVSLMAMGTTAVRDDLIDMGLPARRLRVVRPGIPRVPDAESEPTAARLNGKSAALPSEFLLAVGTLLARKRPDTAVMIARLAGMPIVLAGGFGGRFDPGSLPAYEHAFVTGTVREGELGWLYRNATVLVAASAYEGLDFPVLEARSIGLPVAASDIPVHREVGGSGTAYFPVGDPVAGAEAVAAAEPSPFEDPPTWESCARGYAAIYHEVS